MVLMSLYIKHCNKGGVLILNTQMISYSRATLIRVAALNGSFTVLLSVDSLEDKIHISIRQHIRVVLVSKESTLERVNCNFIYHFYVISI